MPWEVLKHSGVHLPEAVWTLHQLVLHKIVVIVVNKAGLSCVGYVGDLQVRIEFSMLSSKENLQ